MRPKLCDLVFARDIVFGRDIVIELCSLCHKPYGISFILIDSFSCGNPCYNDNRLSRPQQYICYLWPFVFRTWFFALKTSSLFYQYFQGKFYRKFYRNLYRTFYRNLYRLNSKVERIAFVFQLFSFCFCFWETIQFGCQWWC